MAIVKRAEPFMLLLNENSHASVKRKQIDK